MAKRSSAGKRANEPSCIEILDDGDGSQRQHGVAEAGQRGGSHGAHLAQLHHRTAAVDMAEQLGREGLDLRPDPPRKVAVGEVVERSAGAAEGVLEGSERCRIRVVAIDVVEQRQEAVERTPVVDARNRLAHRVAGILPEARNVPAREGHSITGTSSAPSFTRPYRAGRSSSAAGHRSHRRTRGRQRLVGGGRSRSRRGRGDVVATAEAGGALADLGHEGARQV